MGKTALDHVLDLSLHSQHEQCDEIKQEDRPEHRDVQEPEKPVRLDANRNTCWVVKQCGTLLRGA